jgi:hypothetical protein
MRTILLMLLIACERDPRRETEIYLPPAATDTAVGVSENASPALPGEAAPTNVGAESIEAPLPELMPVVAHDDPPPPAPPKPIAVEAMPLDDELPADPPVNRADYKIWFKGLSAKERHAITLYCRMNPVNPERECGGIGPLHIQPPPPLMRTARGLPEPADTGEYSSPARMSRHDWYLSLTRSERAWVDHTCEAQDNYNSGELCTFMTPLVVSFDRGAVQYSHDVSFFATATDWPTAATPWLAVDRDGAITGAELFGSATPMADGFAADGFAALAALDANHDGVIDARDPMFAKLVLWRDRDGDAQASAGELQPASATIVSISLAATATHRCDARNNCEGLTSTMIWSDARGDRHEGSVIDVYLPPR